MEKYNFKYNAKKSLPKRAHVGVVGSGDLEVLMEPVNNDEATVLVRTRFDGYEEVWKRILSRFFEENSVCANIEINDFGATPGMIKLRLLQALEVSGYEK